MKKEGFWIQEVTLSNFRLKVLIILSPGYKITYTYIIYVCCLLLYVCFYGPNWSEINKD